MRLVLTALLLSLLASPAFASPPRTVTLPSAPVALLVDGVKVGSTDRALIPKTVPRSIARCSASGCTIVVTY